MPEYDEGGILYTPRDPGTAVFIDGHGAQLVTRDSREPEWILSAADAAPLFRLAMDRADRERICRSLEES